MEGWNDPPKNVGMSTGNLKINLNKRVAFPLSSAAAAQSSSQSASPLLLPPKPESAVNEPQTADTHEPPQRSVEDPSSQKEKVLAVLNARVLELGAAVQASAAAKLKTLKDDWNLCDSEIQMLLVELCNYLEAKDTKNAAAVQRKIVMKGCSKQWLHAIRQIMNHEALQAKEDEARDEVFPAPENVSESSDKPVDKTEWI